MQRSVYGATQQEVRKKLAQLTAALDAGTYKEPCKMTVGQWLDIWSADYLGGVKPFTVTLFTGMREGEVLGLMWSCVDFEKGTILIDKQLQQEKKRGGQYVFAPLKNDKARTITPAPWVMDLLKHHRAQQAELRLRAGPMWEDSGLVFTNELGHHLARCTLVNAFKAVVTSIGRPDARFHDLRHSYAVAAIRSGDDIKTVQGNLGHATAAFTLDVYGHVTDQMKRESAARMESYIKDVLNL